MFGEPRSASLISRCKCRYRTHSQLLRPSTPIEFISYVKVAADIPLNKRVYQLEQELEVAKKMAKTLEIELKEKEEQLQMFKYEFSRKFQVFKL